MGQAVGLLQAKTIFMASSTFPGNGRPRQYSGMQWRFEMVSPVRTVLSAKLCTVHKVTISN
jgi:hypothetical protein